MTSKPKATILSLLLIWPASMLSISDVPRLKYLNTLIPENTELRERVLTTLFCQDCDYLPKVEHAGEIFFDSAQNTSYQLMHNGIKILQDCYYGKWMTTLIELSKGHHEPQEEKLFHETLKCLPSNPIMIELGSYWGYYSMWLKKEIPDAQVYLIEPDPKNILIGQNNFKLNNLFGTFEHAMIDEKSCNTQTFIDWDYKEHTIPATNMDDFAEKHSIPFIDILHSDIQGAEIAMLKGCQKLMSEKRIGYYFISTHRGAHKKCLSILKEYNLEILIAITRKESFSADGLIVAKLPHLPSPQNLAMSRRTTSLQKTIKRIVNEC